MSRRTTELTAFELRDLPPGTGDPVTLSSDSPGDSTADDWLPATVPGGVHEALMAAGRIVDPRRGGHERDADWVESRDWWFRARFDGPEHAAADRVRLELEGLDTLADVWLDGEPLGRHRNQFTPFTADLSGRVAPGGRHVLLLRFAPPLPDGTGTDPLVVGTGRRGALPQLVGLRKAAFSWGWDFAPRIPNVGPWRPARLHVERHTVLTGHHVALSDLAPDHGRGVVTVRADVDDLRDPPDEPLSLDVTLTAPDGRVVRGRAPLTDGAATVDLPVDEPVLWWTHDLGEPALHDVRLELRSGDEVVDVRDDRVGLRTVELDRSPEPVEGGRLFCFVLNGVRLFVRGANWVPPSPYVGSVDAALLRDRVLRAREGHLTMLRVWGGGVYEHDAFYDACDELGVLVWQDFMFACVDYPAGSPDLRDEVAAEARTQVRRLRNHACLALWCGNNEVEVLHLIAHDGREAGDWGRRLFHDVLPDAVAAHDGWTPYWPGSPWGEGGPDAVNGERDGDRHDWEVWHGLVIPGVTTGSGRYPTPGDARHYRRYADDTARFVSELGLLSAPDPTTLDRWLPCATHRDAVLDQHVLDRPVEKSDELLAVTTGVPEDLDEYVALSQAVQAGGLAFAVEHFRRRQPLTAGALVWQLDDTWPAMTWSLVDVDGVPKAAYYALARASAPVAVSLRARRDGTGTGVELWLANNTRRAVTLAVDVELGTFDGTERRTTRVEASAGPGTSALAWTGPVPHDADHYAWAASPDGAFPAARAHFAELGDLRLPGGRVETTVVAGGLELRAHGYCYGVRVTHPVPAMRLSDNCFDLRDDERRVVGVHGADPASLTVAATIPRARSRTRGTS